MNAVVARLDSLPPAQRKLWPQFSAIGSRFVLYGGTALALQVGGRTSVDFDFFTAEPLNHARLAKDFPFLRGASLQQQAVDTAAFVVGIGGDVVAVSFFGSLDFGRVSDPIRFADNGVHAAGLLDLAAQKVKVIQQRAEAKDYQDIHKLLSVGVTLEMALGAAQALYPEFNAAISLKALSYYGDVSRLPDAVQRDLRTAASRVRDIPRIQRQNASLLPSLDSIAQAPEIGDSLKPNRQMERGGQELGP
ncbi:MAG TPA: nucleotidyl transferase AbiEii/AbiGii toxin family protein [Opitutaceae bacterium]|nr:nucleotidyl transferase AbiEii/AbiGii toxin family protein [Opitutaceae bacterium]